MQKVMKEKAITMLNDGTVKKVIGWKKGEFAYNKSTSSDAPWGAVKRLDKYEMGVLSTLYIVFTLKMN